jgi:hypothetical protein
MDVPRRRNRSNNFLRLHHRHCALTWAVGHKKRASVETRFPVHYKKT